MAAVEPGYDPPTLFAHEAPGLGVVAVSVAQRGAAGAARVLAHAYPLHPQALGPLLASLAEANCLILVDEDITDIPVGDDVPVAFLAQRG